jgi:hypothetical protein
MRKPGVHSRHGKGHNPPIRQTRRHHGKKAPGSGKTSKLAGMKI